MQEQQVDVPICSSVNHVLSAGYIGKRIAGASWCTCQLAQIGVDDRAWHGGPERPLPKLRTCIGIERVDAVVGCRHKENIVCAEIRHIEIGHIERLSKDKAVHGHTE